MPETAPKFEVASIRPVGENGGRPSIEFAFGGIRAANVTLKMLLQMAYDIRPEQLSGGAGWTDSDAYAVIAKGPEGAPALSESAQMDLTRKRLQSLLSERFHLALKLEANPADGYVLTVEKRGHKMALVNDPATHRLRQTGPWELQAESVEMALLAQFLSIHLRGTVAHRTGLEGRYSFHLNWNPELHDGDPPSSPDERAGEALITAVQEQLGLRLERKKVTTNRYTIEHAEKPAN